MRRTTVLALVAAAVLAAAPAAGLPLTSPPPLVVGDVRFADYERVAHLDAYVQPVTAVGYADGRAARIEVPLSNPGPSAVTVVGMEPFPELLGLLEVEATSGIPVTLAAGEEVTVRLRTRFTNCRYYTERAVNRFTGPRVTVAGPGGEQAVTLTYPSEVVLRSPTILGCPDRVLDRSARQRLLARDE